MANNYAFHLTHTPSILIHLVDAIRPDRYDDALEPERFTLRESIAHLADWEVIWLDRIALAVEYPGSQVEGEDETKRSIDHHYSTKDIHQELEVFDNRRRDTVAFLLGLAEDDWDKSIVHSQNGEMTVTELVRYIIGHDLYHINQVSCYLK